MFNAKIYLLFVFFSTFFKQSCFRKSQIIALLGFASGDILLIDSFIVLVCIKKLKRKQDRMHIITKTKRFLFGFENENQNLVPTIYVLEQK